MLNSCFFVPAVYRLANELDDDQVDDHATSSAISLILHLESSLLLKHHYLSESSLAGASINISIS
tara:strand:- start:438 stop:632 length:195 start_codon:yes stop_codon:yes gene_type:complete